MDVCIILNPNAGSAAQAEVLRAAIHADSTMTLWETTRESSARELAASALRRVPTLSSRLVEMALLTKL